MGSGRMLIPVTLFLIALSLLLQLISFVSPGWMVITFYIKSESSIESKIDILVALWYTRTCVTGGINESYITWFYQDMAQITAGGLPRVEAASCNEINGCAVHKWLFFGFLHLFVSGDSYSGWVENEVEITLALMTCIVSVVLVVIGYKNKTSTKSYSAMSSGFMLFSGIILWIPVGKVASYIKEVYDLNREIPIIQMSMGTSWALILAAIAAFISNICALLLLIIACKQNQETSGIIYPNAENENGIVSNIPMQQMQVPNDGNHVYPTAPPPYIQAPMIVHTYGYNMYHSMAHPSGHFGPVYPQYTQNYQISPPPQYTEKPN